jgi:hypothetical protein
VLSSASDLESNAGAGENRPFGDFLPGLSVVTGGFWGDRGNRSLGRRLV